jgi:hypothetical protein
MHRPASQTGQIFGAAQAPVWRADYGSLPRRTVDGGDQPRNQRKWHVRHGEQVTAGRTLGSCNRRPARRPRGQIRYKLGQLYGGRVCSDNSGAVTANPVKMQEISLRAGPGTKRVMAKNNRPIEQGRSGKLSICSGTDRLTTLYVDSIP